MVCRSCRTSTRSCSSMSALTGSILNRLASGAIPASSVLSKSIQTTPLLGTTPGTASADRVLVPASLIRRSSTAPPGATPSPYDEPRREGGGGYQRPSQDQRDT